MRFFWYVTDITLSWNVAQWWIVDIFDLYGIWTKWRNVLLLSYIEGLQALYSVLVKKEDQSQGVTINLYHTDNGGSVEEAAKDIV